jgi:hypothetical protein
MTRTPIQRKVDSRDQLSREGGVGIAGKQRIRIKGKLREELDYHALAYVLHTMAKRRVDARRRLEAEQRALRGEAPKERS